MTVAKANAAAGPRKKPASVAAREAEANDDGYITLKKCGVTLKVGVGDSLPGAVIDAYMQGGQLASWKAMKAHLGDEQWRKLIDAGATQGDLQDLDKEIADLSGN